jgi:MFS family permease
MAFGHWPHPAKTMLNGSSTRKACDSSQPPVTGRSLGALNVGLLAVAFILAGVGIGCVETAEHAAVAVAAPAPIRGSAFGLLASVQSFGNLAASGIAGIIWTVVSPTAAFLYIAAWMLVAVALLCRNLE